MKRVPFRQSILGGNLARTVDWQTWGNLPVRTQVLPPPLNAYILILPGSLSKPQKKNVSHLKTRGKKNIFPFNFQGKNICQSINGESFVQCDEPIAYRPLPLHFGEVIRQKDYLLNTSHSDIPSACTDTKRGMHRHNLHLYYRNAEKEKHLTFMFLIIHLFFNEALKQREIEIPFPAIPAIFH